MEKIKLIISEFIELTPEAVQLIFFFVSANLHSTLSRVLYVSHQVYTNISKSFVMLVSNKTFTLKYVFLTLQYSDFIMLIINAAQGDSS